MPPELIRLNKPRWLVAMVLVLIVLSVIAHVVIGLLTPRPDYPEAPTRAVAVENGQPVALDANQHVRVWYDGGSEKPWESACRVDGDVQGYREGGFVTFETGAAGEYTVTCARPGEGFELQVADRAPFEDWIAAMNTERTWFTVLRVIPPAILAVLLGALAWYAIAHRRRAAQLRQFEAAGLPHFKQGVGSTVGGLIILLLGMIVFAGLGALFGPRTPALYSSLFVILGTVMFVGGGGVKEDQLRRHVDGWRQWYAAQMAGHAQVQAPMQVPANVPAQMAGHAPMQAPMQPPSPGPEQSPAGAAPQPGANAVPPAGPVAPAGPVPRPEQIQSPPGTEGPQ